MYWNIQITNTNFDGMPFVTSYLSDIYQKYKNKDDHYKHLHKYFLSCKYCCKIDNYSSLVSTFISMKKEVYIDMDLY